MIDFIKILNLKTFTNLAKNSHLKEKWKSLIDYDGILLHQYCELNGLAIITKKYHSSLSGSLHKNFNLGEHNHNDFTFSRLCQTIDGLVQTLGIDANNSILNNIEFGVNIELPFSVSLILDNIITYKGRRFSCEISKGKQYFQYIGSQSIIKIYNKGLQYSLSKNLLRFEIKVIKMQFLHQKGLNIWSLNDLKNIEFHAKIGELLKLTFEEILFEDPNINLNLLSTKEKLFYVSAINPNSWLLPEKPIAADYKRIQRNKTKYKNLINEYGSENSYSKLVTQEITKQWNKLCIS